jgi:glucose-1-phosphate adenylyltransferase
LFFGVVVDVGTEVRRSVVLPEVEIGRSCYIANAMIVEGCSIPHGTVIGRVRDDVREHFHVNDQGVVLVSRGLLANLRRSQS